MSDAFNDSNKGGRNAHAVGAWSRKAGPHSGSKRPDEEEPPTRECDVGDRVRTVDAEGRRGRVVGWRYREYAITWLDDMVPGRVYWVPFEQVERIWESER